MGQKLVCFGGPRGVRSRQDESIEVHEAGRIRPSSGSNGGHVLSLHPLIWRSLLGCPLRSVEPSTQILLVLSPDLARS
jgi:hypothetical protein